MAAENSQNIAGHLRAKNGYWQMILSFKDSTGLKEKGNKRREKTVRFSGECIIK